MFSSSDLLKIWSSLAIRYATSPYQRGLQFKCLCCRTSWKFFIQVKMVSYSVVRWGMIGVETMLVTAFVVFWKKLFVAVKHGTVLCSACVNSSELAALHRRNWLHKDVLVVSTKSVAGVNSPGIWPPLPMLQLYWEFDKDVRTFVRTFSFVPERWFSGILQKLQLLSLLVPPL